MDSSDVAHALHAAHDTTPIAAVRARAYTVPTDGPEADGTFEWKATTIVVVEIDAGGCTGLGYTYSDACVAALIRQTLAPEMLHADARSTHALGARLWRRVRNLGRSGVAATAISAIDCALWDLNARLLGQPLVKLLGGALRERVPVYGSGGFTNYTAAQLQEQFSRWVERDGCHAVKMKIGRDPSRDVSRVECARRAIGDAALFVDANGALSVRSALACANRLAEFGVVWFEEPVSSDDLAGLTAVRDAAPVTIDIAAGEYAYTADDFRRLLDAHAVDVVQADVTRCGGVTGFLQAAALCDAAHVPLSAHCAPALHLHAASAAPGLRHQEWFHDHVRIEAMLFDGAPPLRDGSIAPDLTRPGCGLALKHRDAERFALSV
ncbi:enolase C-terminal domain-like protein [Trinickia caryophylli]|nr:enolase C-terminal domain-like protein [Trinickia caryophylli]PMS13083.1 mandelate racemase [Trinickia caryophylli]TRX14684.1 mandelate racemase [Trinickia caryophylli]WQE14527.1 enolase C-terminal domain-like protein [Trinickia caryophylli]